MQTLRLNDLAFRNPTPLALDMTSVYGYNFRLRHSHSEADKAAIEGYYNDERVYIEIDSNIYKTLISRYKKMKPQCGRPGMMYLFCHVCGVVDGVFGVSTFDEVKPCKLVIEYPKRDKYISLCREYNHGVSWMTEGAR